jgi:hypothetical protein
MQKRTPVQHDTDITPQRSHSRNIQLLWLMQRYPHIPVFALYNFISGFFSIGLMAAFAVLLRSPFIFPSLGPTAFHYFSGRLLLPPLRATPSSDTLSAQLPATLALQ